MASRALLALLLTGCAIDVTGTRDPIVIDAGPELVAPEASPPPTPSARPTPTVAPEAAPPPAPTVDASEEPAPVPPNRVVCLVGSTAYIGCGPGQIVPHVDFALAPTTGIESTCDLNTPQTWPRPAICPAGAVCDVQDSNGLRMGFCQ